MKSFLQNIFSKEEIVDIEKLNLQSLLSVQSCINGGDLLQLAARQGRLIDLQGYIVLTTHVNPDIKYALEQEVDLIKKYISCYKLLQPEEVYVNLNVSQEETSSIQLYPFTLLPLIQNALQFGYNTMEKFPVRIKIKVIHNSLKVEISNRVNHHLANQEKTSVIDNLKSRLNLLYPNGYNLIINSNSMLFKVTLLLT